MNNVYFNDLFSIVKEHLLSARKYVKIAVCWLNFDMFKQTFKKLIDSGVSIDIIISNTPQNHRHDQLIDQLKSCDSITIRYACLPRNALMHEKFCVIDGVKILVGSYNWSSNASASNCENLLIIEDQFVVNKFEFEFYELLGLDFNYYIAQRRSQRTGQIYVATVEQEGEYQSLLSIYKIEDGYFSYEPVYTDLFDISLYLSLTHIGDEYYEEHEQNQEYGMGSDINNAHSKWEFDFHKFMIDSFPSLKEFPYIHALGVINHRGDFRYIDEIFLEIIWKNRFISYLIEDEYEIPQYN